MFFFNCYHAFLVCHFSRRESDIVHKARGPFAPPPPLLLEYKTPVLCIDHTVSPHCAKQIMMTTIVILCKSAGKSNNPPCFPHRDSNLQPSRPCCANHSAHTSCLPCVFTTHSPNYSGSKQLNSMWNPQCAPSVWITQCSKWSAHSTRQAYTDLTHSQEAAPAEPQEAERSRGEHVTRHHRHVAA